jgi:hypothetical protein
LNYFQEHRGSFPNIAGTVVHLSKDNGTWRAYYISPYSRSKKNMVAVHPYSTPKPGGQQKKESTPIESNKKTDVVGESGDVGKEPSQGSEAVVESGLPNMPSYGAIPNQTIGHCFRNHPNDGHTAFAVHQVKGNGNSLYHCLSLSSHYSDAMPKKQKFLRDLLQSFAGQKKNHAFLSCLWTVLKKSNNEETYKQWVASIGQLNNLVGIAEWMLFSACLQIHVVCV